MTEQINIPPQTLGALRSEITLTLHSQYATRIWHGRQIVREGKKIVKQPIMSMPQCLSTLTLIQKDASKDDPYADYFLIQFEEMVLNNSIEMKELIQRVVNIYAEQIPEGVDIQRCSNISPLSYPIYVNSPLGYKLIYLLSDFDMLAKTAMTASYIGIMTKEEARRWLEAGAILIRRCFGTIQKYHHTGLTRQDVINNTARFRDISFYHNLTLPQDILDGIRRAKFAPEIKLHQSDEAENDDIQSMEDFEKSLLNDETDIEYEDVA